MLENGRVVFKSNISAQLVINEIERGVVTKINTESLEKIREFARQQINNLCSEGFNACRRSGSDAVRAGEYQAKDDSAGYDAASGDWKKYFKATEYVPEVSIELMKISNNTQIS